MDLLLKMDPDEMKPGVKRQRRVKYEEIDVFVSEYVSRCREYNCIVTGPMICNAAESFVEKRICTWTNPNSAHLKDGLEGSRKETLSFARYCKEKELLPQQYPQMHSKLLYQISCRIMNLGTFLTVTRLGYFGSSLVERRS